MKFCFYPGCTLSTTAEEMSCYAKLSAEILGFTLNEIEDWQCCGAVFPLGTDEVAPKLPAVRALNYAKKQNMPLVTLCSACHQVFKQVNYQMRNDNVFRTDVFNFDNELDYAGETEVLHFLEVIQQCIGFDTLKSKVTNPLSGRKIGAYYGCMLLRPGDIMQFDDPENPVIFENFLRALGAEPVFFPYRNECCGSYRTLKEKEKVREMSGKITASASERGATELITACPLCKYNVDVLSGGEVPVYYFTELLAEALGIKAENPEVSNIQREPEYRHMIIKQE